MLAFAGRITKQKSLGVALDALGQVDGRLAARRRRRAGPAGRARRRVAELGLDGRVRFLGALGRDDVLALFRAADASLLTSSWENFPHTVVEALAVGTPVIATSVGGVPELVHDGENGLLVPAGDVEARCRRDSPRARRGRDCASAWPRRRRRSVEQLRPEAVYSRLEAILEAASR